MSDQERISPYNMILSNMILSTQVISQNKETYY